MASGTKSNLYYTRGSSRKKLGKETNSPAASSPKLPEEEVNEEEHELIDISSDDDDLDDNLPKTGIINGNPYSISSVQYISSYGDDMDASEPVIKKHKGHSFDHLTPHGSIEKSKEQMKQEQELGISPISPIPLAIISAEDGLVNINGYKVKSTFAPILKAIFAKYGDITRNCSYKSLSIKTSLLEVLCKTILTLRCSDIEAVLANIEVIENEISDLETSKIEVPWLRECLEDLQKVAASYEKSLQLIREDKVTVGIATSLASKELQQIHAELAEAYERFSEAEKFETAMKFVTQNIEDKFMRIEAEKSCLIQELNELP